MTLSWSEFYTKIILSAKEKRTLVSASFELTSRCNLNCKMCYICESKHNYEKIEKELTVAQWIHLAKEACDIGLLYVTLTGGEVFLREDFREIYENLTKLGFVIQIYTNGTLINQEIVKWLSSAPPFKVSITLYGASRETYQKVTGHAAGYDQVTRAIDSLIAAGIQIELKTTVVEGNRLDFDRMSLFAKERNLSLGVVNYISPRREGFNSDPLGNRLSPQVLVDYERHIFEHNRKIQNININQRVEQQSRLSMSDTNDAFQCFAGKCGAWVTWDGSLLACGIMDKPKAYPLKSGFPTAWEELKQECLHIPACQECLDCRYAGFCERCPARLFNEMGYYDKPAPYLCETARKRALNIQNKISLG